MNDLEESWEDLHREPKPEPEPEEEPKMPSVEELDEFLRKSMAALSECRYSKTDPSKAMEYSLVVKHNYTTFEVTGARSLVEAFNEIVTKIMGSIRTERETKAEQRQKYQERLQEAEEDLARSNKLTAGIQAPPMPKR